MALVRHGASAFFMLKFPKRRLIMTDYICRLERIGIAAHEAYRIVFDFLKNFGVVALEDYITEMERDCYVG